MKIFLSAVSGQFKACRDALRSDLSAVGAEVVVQEDFQQHGASLLEKLERYIASCDRIIALVGHAYGFEPEETARPAGQPRRSYTQWEYFFASGVRLNGSRQPAKDIFLYFASPEFLATHAVSQEDDAAQLQQEFIKELHRSGKDWNPFGSLDELRALVLRDGFQLQSWAPQPRNLPYTTLGGLFKGREHILPELHERLKRNPGRALAIYGPAGVGKTRLAIEFAWRYAVDYTALLFVSARSSELLSNLAGLCDSLVINLPEQNLPEEAARVAAVFRWLGAHPGWLLILDNADTLEAAVAVEKMLPQLQRGHVVITSRIADWSSEAQPIELKVLAKEDAAALLLDRTDPRRVKTASDSQEAVVLAGDLDGLALALEQAGAYINKKHLSFSEYRRRWKSRTEEVLTWYDERLMKYPSSVAVTWQTTIDQLCEGERTLFNILAWLAPEPIPLLLLEGYSVDGADARDALAGLASWSLARWMADEEGFTVHRLVQEITRQRLSDSKKQDTLASAVALLDSALPSPEWDQRGWRLWEQLAPHCQTVLDRLRNPDLEPKATRMMNNLATWLMNRAEHGEAEPLFRRALSISERSLSRDDPEVAGTLGNLAMLLQATNRLDQAEPLFRQALSISERSLGPDDPKLAAALNNLAMLLKDTEQLKEAEPLLKQALAITEKRYGPEDPNVATALDKLAELLRIMVDRSKEAEPLYQRALAIDEKSFGLEHPNVARDLSNLAWLYTSDQPEKAEQHIGRALEIDIKALGPNHPKVARDLYIKGELFCQTSRHRDAELLYRQALRIFRKFRDRTGNEHQESRSVRKNYAGLLKAMGLNEDAIAARVRSAINGEPDVSA